MTDRERIQVLRSALSGLHTAVVRRMVCDDSDGDEWLERSVALVKAASEACDALDATEEIV